MKKIHIILVILFGIQLNLLSQNLSSQNFDEIVDIIGNESSATFLKDFKMALNPYETSRYSVVLSKNTKYEFSYYEDESDQIKFNLYKDTKKKSYSDSLDHNDVKPDKITKLKNITQHEYLISKTGVYHMSVKNKTGKNVQTAVVLSFLERLDSEVSEEIIPITKQEENKEQHKLENENKDEVYFFVVEEMPKFRGKKTDEFKKFINEELKYPQEAIDQKVEGRVFVQFTIGADGYVQEAKVVRGSHPALDQEALRIVYSSPRWEPGTQRGQAVNVVLTYPVIFNLYAGLKFVDPKIKK